MNVFADILKNVGPTRLAVIASIVIGLFVFTIFVGGRLAGTDDMRLLYAGLDPADSAKIVAQLDAENVPYTLQDGGTQILVPKNDVMRLRLATAELGLVSDSGVGYEIFDNAETLGTTNFVQNINRIRALEGELSRTIRGIEAVENARVHIVMPQRQLFARSIQEPSATVVIKVRGRGQLPPNRVQAIQSLVATSVPGLAIDRITVVDSSGELLARGVGEGEEGVVSFNDAAEARQSYEIKIARMIENLLERTVGLGKVKAEVNAEMDFDRITTNSESYDPDGQVVRSTQTIEEAEAAQEAGGEQPVTVEENLPDNEDTGVGGELVSNSTSSRTEETVNYEISRTVSNHIRESGVLKRLSVAVLVDGIYTDIDGQEQSYRPRTPEELENLAALVRSAVGYDADRGDIVEVVNMPFVSLEDEFADEGLESLFAMNKQDYLRMAEILTLAVISILVILLIVRPLLTRVLGPAPAAQQEFEPSMDVITDQSAATGAVMAARAGAPGQVSEEQAGFGAAAEEGDQLLNIDRIEGQLKASAIGKIGDIIDKHPEETLQTIRSWMYQT